MQLGDDSLGVGNMLILALARSRALALEGPRQTDRLVSVGRDVGVLPIHHGRDGGVAGTGESSEETVVSTGIHR